MLYMIIEKFHPGKTKDIYARFAEKGRMMPAGLTYINSWVNETLNVCYQVMETDHAEDISEWMHNWSDLSDFEIISVLTSAEAKERILKDPSH